MLRRGMGKMLSDSLGVGMLSELSNGQEVIKHIEDAAPHIALLDYYLPGLSGGWPAASLARSFPPR